MNYRQGEARTGTISTLTAARDENTAYRKWYRMLGMIFANLFLRRIDEDNVPYRRYNARTQVTIDKASFSADRDLSE